MKPQVASLAEYGNLRLCSRFRKLAARGVNRNKLVTAIARELAGFVWAIGRQVPPCAAN
jgi:transposase